MRVASRVPVWDTLSRTRYTQCFLGFSGSFGGSGESRLEGGRVLLEKSAEIQSVVRGLRGQIKGLEDRGCSGGCGGRCAGGVLRGQGYRRTVFSHQDLTEDDGQQDKEQPFGRVRFLYWQLTPDLRGGDKKNRSFGPRRPVVHPALPPGLSTSETLTTRG